MSHKSIGDGRKRQPAKTKVLGGAGKLVLKPHPSEHSAMKSLLKPKNEKECSVERESKPSVQAKTSGSKMELRKNRKRNRKYSSDEATSDENDESDEESMTLVVDGQNVQEMSRGWTALGPRRRPSQKQSILHLYEEMQPCTPKEASKLLDVPASKLEGWVNQSKKKRQKKGEPSIVFQMESNDIDTYIDSNTGAQYIVVEDSGDEGRDVDASKTEVWLERPELENSKKPNLLRKLVNVQDDNSGLPQCSNIVQEINDSNFVIIADTDRKNNLREKIEIFRKFDDMKPCSRKLAAETFGMSAHAFSCLLNKRVYLEKKYKKKVLEEVALLRMYDRLQCKNDAHTILGLSVDELRNLLRCRTELENECRKHLSAKERLEGRIVDEVDGRLGNELFAWYQSQQREGKGLTWKQLKSRAHDLAQSLDLVAFAPTDKWLMDWQKSLSSREKANKLPERAKTVYKSDFLIYDLKDASTNLLSALKHFHPDDIFNLCETGLYYRLVPGQSRLRDDWITVLFACNMSGTEKKQLLVSGKSKSPLCFNVLPLPLTYVQNGEACVTKEMVSNYLRSWSNELALSRRNVAVILEECSSHSNLNFDYIQFYYTANSSPDMPLRRGIITQTKSAYRQNMASTLLKFDSSHLDEELPKNISIVDALFMLAECWDSVPKSTLIAAFSTAFPLGHANLEEDNTPFEDDDVAKLNELDDEIRVHLDGPPPRIRALGDDTAANVSYDSPTSSDDEQNIVGEMVVHAEGTVSIGDENIEEFDIDTLMCTSSSSPRKINDVEIISSKNEIVASRKKPAISGLRSILAAAQKSEESPPSVNDVKAALSTIKRFLQSNGGTLEDLTDYTQLETKVLSKLPAWCVG